MVFFPRLDSRLKPMSESHTVQELREKIAETIQNHDYAQLYLLADNQNDVLTSEEWIHTMKQDREWCDDIFVYLAATLLKKEIVMIPIYPRDGHGGTGKIVVTPDEKIGNPIYLLYYKDVHFQSIVPIEAADEESSSN